MTTSADLIFPGDSEMARRMRALDWSQTDLGLPENWNESLRTAVSICLTSRFPIVLWWGPNLTLLYNDAYIPALGPGKHPQWLGRSGRECWSDIWDVVGPLLEQVLESGRATWSEELQLFMNRHLPREEVYFTFSYSPILIGGASEVGGIFCAVTEATDYVLGRRRAATLRELTRRLATLPTPEAACERAAEVLEENGADVPFAAFYFVEPSRGEARLVASVRDGDRGGPWPIEAVWKSREPVELERHARHALVVPVVAPGFESPGAVLVAGVNPGRLLDDAYRDFFQAIAMQVGTAMAEALAYAAERKRAESLAELDRAKTAFFSNVSHEFRTPLALMLGPVEDALADPIEPLSPRNAERLSVAHRNGLRLLKLVNTLLDFSRIEAGRADANYERTDIAAYTEELASVFRSAIERAGLALEIDTEPIPAPVFVDHEMWEKVVLNLLSNAFKFTLRGRISVSVRTHGDGVRIEVSDTGSGIPADELPRVFERFHRVKGAEARTHEGSGIGLALVQELVRLHGGVVEVSSELGRGTTFAVTLRTGSAHLPTDRLQPPRTLHSTALGAAPYVEEALRWLPDAAVGSVTELGPSSSGVSTAGARVLVADDNQDMREYLRRLLSAHWQVEVAGDGEEALASILRRPPDLVLADVMMPKRDGFALLKEIRERPETRSLPVLLLSARAGEEARIEGLDAGADDYLTKPFSARELLARVNVHIELSRVRHEAETRVRHSEAMFRALAESSAALIWAVDASAALTYLNPRFLEFFGDSFEQIVGAGWRELVDLEASPDYMPAFVRAQKLREPFRQRVRVRSADGSWRWLESHARPVFAADGSFGGHVGISLDITDVMEVARTLRESEQRFRVLADSAPALIWVNDPDGCEYVNRGYLEFLGVDIADVRGYDWARFIHPDDRDAYVRTYLDAVERRGIFEAEFRFLRHDGEYRQMRSVGQPRIGPYGEFLGYAGLTVDVTEHKSAEAEREELLASAERSRTEAERANQAKDDFLAVLSHELRSPMNAMLGWLRILKTSGARDPELLERAVETLERNVWVQAQVISDLLDVSRILSGKLELDRERIDLSALVHGAVESLRPSAAGKEIALTIERCDPDVEVDGDDARLQQVLTNLLVNAIKFTESGGAVSVSLARSGDGALLRVTDTGQGIDPEFLPLLFERFRQGDRGSARKHGGLGLGLSIVKNIVELHGGDVRAESDGPGRGASFRVTLPLAQARTVLPRRARLPAIPDAALREPLDVLIVDDDPDTRHALELALGEDGSRVRVAASVREGLDAYRERAPDVLISDVGMPGEDGFVLIRAIREREEGRSRRTLAIAVTGFAGRRDHEMALRAGFDEHVAKPVDPGELIDRVRALAASRPGA